MIDNKDAPILNNKEEKLAALKLTVVQYVIVAVLAILLYNLFRVGVVGATAFRALAEQNSIRRVSIIAARGRLFDRENRLIVSNYTSATCVLFIPRDRNIENDLPLIARGLHLDLEQLRSAVHRHNDLLSYGEVAVKQDLTQDEKAFIEARRNELPELQIIEETRRLYPRDGFAAHLIGYSGRVNGEDIKNLHHTAFLPGDYVGKTGVEQTYDEVLRGQDGFRDVIVDSLGRQLGTLRTQNAVTGRDLRLTIDNDLQRTAELALGARNGAVVAMDPRNGEVLALVSRPSYDANMFSLRVDSNDWNHLTTDVNHPLVNNAIQAQLAPASTFKILMSVAGLQEGIAQDLEINCTGGWDPYGKFHHCHDRHGAVNIHNAIPFSCDTFYYILGDKLGIDKISEYAMRFGFGQRTGIDLPDEKPGLMPSSEWSLNERHTKWLPDETLDVSIGQGPIEASPIQLARIIGGIASGGHFVRPHLVFPDQLSARFRDSLLARLTGSGNANLPISPANWTIVTDGMAEVTQAGMFHTAPRAHLEGIDFAGKTGTAQVNGHEALSHTTRTAADLTNVWFVGVTPRRNPELVVAVLWQNGASSSDAACIAAQVVSAYVQKKRRIEHNLSPGTATSQAEVGAVWLKASPMNSKQLEAAPQTQLERFFIHSGQIAAENPANGRAYATDAPN